MKVLILREEGIGNSLQSTPMYASLKKNIPGVQLDVWIDPRAYNIMEGHPLIDNLFKWPKVPTNNPYDYGIVALFNSGSFVPAARQICKKLLFHPKIDYVRKSETLHNLEIVKQINGWKGEMYPNSIYISSIDLKYGEEITKNLKRPVISFSIGNETMVEVHRKRFWRNDKWLQTINLLHEKYEPTFVFLGAKAEKKESEALLRNIPSKINLINLFEKTTIKQAASVIKNSDLFVSLDCGLMHIASAVRTKLIALFGPTSEIKSKIWTDPKNYAIVRNHVSCERCYTMNPGLFQQCSNQVCMTGLRPQQILDAIEERNFL
jgi:ADP-heptose:LPS heptosyltransferase